jgi:hypothetical protein
VPHRIGIYEDEDPDRDTTADDSGIYDDGDTYGQRSTEELTP